MLEHHEVVAAFQRLARHWLDAGAPIQVLPLRHHLDAALHHLLGLPTATYDPRAGEWAYIVNTNGDVYSHAEAYTREGYMGNLFADTFRSILSSDAHARSLVPRLDRARTCDACRFGGTCSRVPLIESLPSERAYDADGTLRCPVAEPMIAFFREELTRDDAHRRLLEEGRERVPEPV